MAGVMKNMISEIMTRPQKDGAYKRVLPSKTRWKTFTTLLEDKLGSLIGINLCMLLFCAPIIALMIYRNIMLASNGMLYPFGGGLGVGYPAVPDLSGVAEAIQLSTDLVFFALFFLGSFLAAIGLAGGAYAVRNLVRTNGTVSIKDFWLGIGKHYVSAMFASALVALFLFLAVYITNISNAMIATGANAVGLTIVKIVAYLVFALVVLVAFWILALGVNFRDSVWGTFRSASIATIGLFPITALGVVASLAPCLLLFLSDFFSTLAIVFYLMFGLAFTLLVWFSFVQWAIDQCTVNGVAYEDEKGKTVVKVDTKKEEQRKMTLSKNFSYLSARPMMGMDEGKTIAPVTSIDRSSLTEVTSSADEVRAEADEYAKAHEGEEKYQAYLKVWNDRDKALQLPKKGRSKMLGS